MKRKIYFTADWHVGHANCLKFDKRPFRDLNHMHESLIKNFNYLVPKHGITYFLGDMGFRGNGLLRSIIDQLNGTKVLVRGNHDGKSDAMYNAGFDVVVEKAQISIGNNIITMTHCPLHGVYREDTRNMRSHTPGENWHKEAKHMHKYSIEDFGQFHLHGHIHSSKTKTISSKIDDTGRQMDVGVTAWNYKPVTMSDIMSWIDNYKKETGN